MPAAPVQRRKGVRHRTRVRTFASSPARATTVLGLKHSSQKLALFGALCQDHLRESSQRGGRPRRSWSAIVRHDGERQSSSHRAFHSPLRGQYSLAPKDTFKDALVTVLVLGR